MALTETRPSTDDGAAVADDAPMEPTQLEELIGSGDHLVIGRLFIGFSLLFLALASLGLVLAGIDGLSTDGLIGLPDALWTSSLVAMVMMGALPLLLGLGIFIVPRQVGSAAIAFPRAAALSLWGWVVSAGIFAVGVALDGGIAGPDMEGAKLSSVSLGAMMVALSLGMVCVATTVLSHRPLGMGLSKVPFFSWSMLVAAPVWILTFGSTTAHVFLGRVSQANPAGLAEIYDAGIAWFLRAPSVYMLAIPALGIAADVVAKNVGRRIRTYGLVQGFIGAYAVLSFGAWSQFPGSLNTFLWIGWVLLGAVPVLALLGALVDCLRHGRPTASTALIGSVLVFLLILGGALGAALQGLDTAGTGQLFGFDTAAMEWAQGFFLFGAALVGGLAGLSHWSRRIFDAPAPEGQGKGAVTAALLGAGLLGTTYLAEGVAGSNGQSLTAEVFAGLVAVGGLLVLLAALAGLGMTVSAARTGADQPDPDDDTGLTLEWAPAGPPVAGVEQELAYVNSPYPLADLRGDTDEERS
jgi:heme/copper-type cytochrome/quinol oxidase subunit 1